jgi:integrase
LALYTGCRVEEIASLYCEHVKKIEDLWCIEINKDYDRKVKNENAIRTVPLHPILVDVFKFPEYVKKIKTQGNDRVFPELKMANHKYSHGFSKKFGTYLRNKVKIKDPKKVFHSFRHNLSDHLYNKMVMESLIEELTGRAGKTETRKRYTKGYTVKNLYEKCVMKLDYRIDLIQLKKAATS